MGGRWYSSLSVTNTFQQGMEDKISTAETPTHEHVVSKLFCVQFLHGLHSDGLVLGSKNVPPE